MRLVLDNHIIDTPIFNILQDIRLTLNDGRLKVIKQKGNNVVITCPFHKDGFENRPSCQVYDADTSDLERGTFHCFTCGYRAPLVKAVADIYEISTDKAKQFLIDNYSHTTIEETLDLPVISLEKPIVKVNSLTEDILTKYDYYHPYMWQRKLTKDIVDKFRIGYDPETNCLTFPVYDEHNQLVLITRRSVETKMFKIEADKEKPIYLLNYLLNNNIKTADDLLTYFSQNGEINYYSAEDGLAKHINYMSNENGFKVYTSENISEEHVDIAGGSYCYLGVDVFEIQVKAGVTYIFKKQ